MSKGASKNVLVGAPADPIGGHRRDIRGALEAILEAANAADGGRALRKVLDWLVRDGYLVDAGERDRLAAENRRLRLDIAHPGLPPAVVGGSGQMREVRARIGELAGSATPVLILGEPGVGKSLVAHAIHRQSRRTDKPFVHVACRGMPEFLVEAQLFGSAGRDSVALLPARKGSVDAAAGGVLFLDEAAALSARAQVRLRALVGKPVAPETRSVRLIAASSRSLDGGVAPAAVRHDFYGWLSTSTIVVPPLRHRKQDLPALIDFFVRLYAREHCQPARGVSASTLEAMTSYEWPGNVSELSAAIDRAVILSNGPLLQAHHLPPAVRPVTPAALPLGLGEALASYERELLQDALARTGGTRSKAARLLQTAGRILNYKIRRHGIDYRRFKSPE